MKSRSSILRKNAEAMSQIRKKYAQRLAEQIRLQLADLNFLETGFDLEVIFECTFICKWI